MRHYHYVDQVVIPGKLALYIHRLRDESEIAQLIYIIPVNRTIYTPCPIVYVAFPVHKLFSRFPFRFNNPPIITTALLGPDTRNSLLTSDMCSPTWYWLTQKFGVNAASTLFFTCRSLNLVSLSLMCSMLSSVWTNRLHFYNENEVIWIFL